MHGPMSRYGYAGAAALLAAALVVACAGPAPSRRAVTETGPAHPAVDTGLDTCASCHAQVTPRATAQWGGGRHGMALVGCVVCHGSTGADFKARPGTSACQGCHAAEVASVTRDGAAQGCFGCHPAHALRAAGKASPHGLARKEGGP